MEHETHKENKLKRKSRTGIIILPAQSAQKHTTRFEAIATELRAVGAGNVRAMDVEAAVHQTHGDAPEHSSSSDMDSEVVFSVIPGDQRQKVMVIHCDDEKANLTHLLRRIS